MFVLPFLLRGGVGTVLLGLVLILVLNLLVIAVMAPIQGWLKSQVDEDPKPEASEDPVEQPPRTGPIPVQKLVGRLTDRARSSPDDAAADD